jgi:aspartate carbamoyltransferase catalytic subunit
MNLKHVIDTQQFSVPDIMELFERTGHMERIVKRGGTRDYEDSILASLFYSSSTRTRFSFEAAMHRLGGKVLSTETARAFSSDVPGEQLEDTIRIIATYCDVIVLRHTEEGGAKRAAAVSSVPLVNAGDGPGGQHPTQALLDLYTIYHECHTLDGLSVAFAGALDSGRTVRSLAYLLGKFERVKLYFISPPELRMKQDILDHLQQRGVWFHNGSTLDDVLPHVDVLYQTRIERSKLLESNVDTAQYNLTADKLQRMKANAIVMHPLPRSVEIDPQVDLDPRAAYFRQARNGLYVRMALLTMLLDSE